MSQPVVTDPNLLLLKNFTRTTTGGHAPMSPLGYATDAVSHSPDTVRRYSGVKVCTMCAASAISSTLTTTVTGIYICRPCLGDGDTDRRGILHNGTYRSRTPILPFGIPKTQACVKCNKAWSATFTCELWCKTRFSLIIILVQYLFGCYR